MMDDRAGELTKCNSFLLNRRDKLRNIQTWRKKVRLCKKTLLAHISNTMEYLNDT